MMDCKKIKELLMTDYVDGEADGSIRGEVLAHLAGCDKCRAFEAELRQKVIFPLRMAEKHYPSDFVWENIKRRIRVAARITLADVFRPLRPVLVASAVALVLLAVAVASRLHLAGNGAVEAYLEEQAEFMTSLEGDASDANGLGNFLEDLSV